MFRTIALFPQFAVTVAPNIDGLTFNLLKRPTFSPWLLSFQYSGHLFGDPRLDVPSGNIGLADRAHYLRLPFYRNRAVASECSKGAFMAHVLTPCLQLFGVEFQLVSKLGEGIAMFVLPYCGLREKRIIGAKELFGRQIAHKTWFRSMEICLSLRLTTAASRIAVSSNRANSARSRRAASVSVGIANKAARYWSSEAYDFG